MSGITWEARQAQMAEVLELQRLAATALRDGEALNRAALNLTEDPKAMGKVLGSLRRYAARDAPGAADVAGIVERLEALWPAKYRARQAEARRRDEASRHWGEDKRRATAELGWEEPRSCRDKGAPDWGEAQRLASDYGHPVRAVCGALLRAVDHIAEGRGDTAELRRQLDAATGYGTVDMAALYQALGYRPEPHQVRPRCRPDAADQPAEGKIIAFRGGERRP